VWDAVQVFLDERAKRTVSLPHTWLVPRLEKRDAVLDDIDGFVDRWLLTAGACVIDPPATADRIEPLPVPAAVRERDAWARLRMDMTRDVLRAAGAQRVALPAARSTSPEHLESAI
jgi:hypothetical protein